MSSTTKASKLRIKIFLIISLSNIAFSTLSNFKQELRLRYLQSTTYSAIDQKFKNPQSSSLLILLKGLIRVMDLDFPLNPYKVLLKKIVNDADTDDNNEISKDEFRIYLKKFLGDYVTDEELNDFFDDLTDSGTVPLTEQKIDIEIREELQDAVDYLSDNDVKLLYDGAETCEKILSIETSYKNSCKKTGTNKAASTFITAQLNKLPLTNSVKTAATKGLTSVASTNCDVLIKTVNERLDAVNDKVSVDLTRAESLSEDVDIGFLVGIINSKYANLKSRVEDCVNK